jgi:hypothetical protein
MWDCMRNKYIPEFVTNIGMYERFKGGLFTFPETSIELGFWNRSYRGNELLETLYPTDVNFIFGKDKTEVKIPAHRIVLWKFPYFQDKFLVNQENIYMEDMDPEAFKSLIDMIYYGKMTIQPKSMGKFLGFIRMIGIPIKSNEFFINKTNHPSLTTWLFWKLLGKNFNVNFNFKEDIYPRYTEMKYIDLCDIINFINEDRNHVEAITIIYAWIAADTSKRINYLPELLSKIKWEDIRSKSRYELLKPLLLKNPPKEN